MSWYYQCHMTVIPQHSRLLRLMANIDQQIAEAGSLAAELPDGSADKKHAIQWLTDSCEAVVHIERLLDTDCGARQGQLNDADAQQWPRTLPFGVVSANQ